MVHQGCAPLRLQLGQRRREQGETGEDAPPDERVVHGVSVLKRPRDDKADVLGLKQVSVELARPRPSADGGRARSAAAVDDQPARGADALELGLEARRREGRLQSLHLIDKRQDAFADPLEVALFASLVSCDRRRLLAAIALDLDQAARPRDSLLLQKCLELGDKDASDLVRDLARSLANEGASGREPRDWTPEHSGSAGAYCDGPDPTRTAHDDEAGGESNDDEQGPFPSETDADTRVDGDNEVRVLPAVADWEGGVVSAWVQGGTRRGPKASISGRTDEQDRDAGHQVTGRFLDGQDDPCPQERSDEDHLQLGELEISAKTDAQTGCNSQLRLRLHRHCRCLDRRHQCTRRRCLRILASHERHLLHYGKAFRARTNKEADQRADHLQKEACDLLAGVDADRRLSHLGPKT